MGRPKLPRYAAQHRPPPMGTILHIVRVNDGNRKIFTVLSPSMWGTFTHWNGKRTVRCTKHLGDCALCLGRAPQRWVGFLQIANPDGTGRALLELTQLAGHRVVALVPEDESLRGRKICVFRERGTKKSPLCVELVGRHDSDEKLLAPINIEPTLDRLWYGS